jgi:hypothetical protein
MATMEVGKEIGVLCTVEPGPFSEERVVTVETVNGPISGFVHESEIKRKGQHWYCRAIVKSIEPDQIGVLIRGSFFSTNGLANVSPHMALAA